MAILIIIIGLCVGSFLNVCIYRIPREESISFPPSHCTTCNYKLHIKDLVPILSYLFLRGKCRNCKEKISIRYPLIEMLNAIMYVSIYYKFGLSIEMVKFFIFASILLVIGIIDLQTKYVYTSTVIFAIIIALIFLSLSYIEFKVIPWNYLLAAAIGSICIYLIVKITGGVGEGDIEIALIIGLFLGVKGIILSLFISFVLGGIIASLILLLKLKEKKSEMAFGPYLAMGAVISLLYGNEIINWYMTFLKI